MKKDKLEINWIQYFLRLLILILIGLSFTGVTLFFIGYHNLDIGQNMKYLDAKYNLSLVDYPDYSNGISYDGFYAYNLGIHQVLASFVLFVIVILSFFWLILININDPIFKQVPKGIYVKGGIK